MKRFVLRHLLDNVTNRFYNRVFPKLTDLTFLSFLYKIDITGFKISKKKLPDAFLSDCLTDLQLHSTKYTLSKIVPSGV